MTWRNQNINLPLALGESLLMTDFGNPTTGTTEDTNIRFTGTATGQGSQALDWVTVVTTDADGTSFEILRSGLYFVEFTVTVIGTFSPAFISAITLDAPLATRQSNPLIGVAGVLASRRWAGGGAASGGSLFVSAFARITTDLANTAGLGIVRIGLSNGLNTAPPSGNFLTTEAFVRIVKVSDLLDNVV